MVQKLAPSAFDDNTEPGGQRCCAADDVTGTPRVAASVVSPTELIVAARSAMGNADPAEPEEEAMVTASCTEPPITAREMSEVSMP